MKKRIFCTTIFLSLFSLAACNPASSTQQNVESSSSSEQQAKLNIEIKLLNEVKEIEIKKLEVSQADSLMEIMQANFSIKEENGMITAIDGIEQNKGKSFYWTYTINGDMVNTGANDTKLKADDKVEFTYAKF